MTEQQKIEYVIERDGYFEDGIGLNSEGHEIRDDEGGSIILSKRGRELYDQQEGICIVLHRHQFSDINIQNNWQEAKSVMADNDTVFMDIEDTLKNHFIEKDMVEQNTLIQTPPPEKNTADKKLTRDELRALFSEICNKEDWKGEINAVIPYKDFDKYNEASYYFTGGAIDYDSNEDENGMINVHGLGYWAHIGA